jgi:hypothetical protein
VIPYDSVEDGEQLPHDGNESNLLGSAAGDEPVVEGSEDGIASDRGQCSHVEHVAHRGSSSGNASVAAHKAGVVIHRGNPDESGDLVTVDGAKFRHFSQKRAGGDVADARNGLQKSLSFASDWRALDGLTEVAVDGREFLFQERDMAVEPPRETLVSGPAPTVRLHADHLDDLPAPADEFG